MNVQRKEPVRRIPPKAAACIFWAIFVALFLLFQAILIDKGKPNRIGWVMADRMSEYNSAAPIAGFFAVPEDSLDIVFLGSSIVFCGVNPNVIFHEYGYSSYAFGTGLMGMNTTMCFLEESLRTQHPKAVVIDATMLAPFFSEGVNGGYEASIWYMPLSAAKLKFAAKLDNFDDSDAVILPFYQFHSRWKTAGERDIRYLFTDRNDYMLGFCGRETVSMDDAYDRYYSFAPDSAKDPSLEPAVVRFISEAAALCDRYGTQLAFVTFPSMDARNPAIYPFFNTLSDYLSQQNIPYINYLTQDERLLLGKADIADARHLTTSGAKKFSLAMGADLQALFQLPDNRTNPDYAYYADCYEKYTALVKSIPNWEALHAF